MPSVDVRVLISLNISGEATDAIVSSGNDATKHAQFPVIPKLSRLGLVGTEIVRKAANKTEADFKAVAQAAISEHLESSWTLGDPTTMRSRYNKHTGGWDIIDNSAENPDPDAVYAWALSYDSGAGAKPVILGKNTDHEDLNGNSAALVMTPVIMVQYPAS